MQQPAIFGREQEDQAVDNPQQLLEVDLSAECTNTQRLTENAVGRVLDEALSEFEQGGLDPLAELVARGYPIGSPPIAPTFQRAIRNRRVGLAEPALMHQQQEHREIWEQTFRKDLGEVSFDPGWPCQADIVTHETQRDTVANQTPA